MSLADFLFGRRLPSSQDREQRVNVLHGIPIFGLDAFASAAYGPEAALTILRPLGVAGLIYIVPLTTAVIILLAIVYFSYRQTIAAYPFEGGSYTVAKENLGTHFGLLGAAALMIDYLMNVAVGISAGVGALVSAIPELQPETLPLCLFVLLMMTAINLRGVRAPGISFMTPTYLFVACLFAVIALGVCKAVASGGHPQPVVPPPPLPAPVEAAGTWLLLRAFAAGCTAMTGVEAISNGVQAFRAPSIRNARLAQTVIIAVLIVLLAGIGHLAQAYNIGATAPGQPGFQSVLSQLTAAVVGTDFFYFLTISAIVAVVCLSANTSFAGFPRLCRVAAIDGYLPHSFADRGRRLVFSHGIWVLSVVAAILLAAFEGITNRLIPLFAVGAFLAFTLSQAGMVAHWKRMPGRHARLSMAINGAGAIATGGALAIIIAAKFTEGAWVVVLLAPVLVAMMAGIRRHYDRVARETAPLPDFLAADLRPPLVIVPIENWSSVAQKALRFALSMSDKVQAVHVDCGDGAAFRAQWKDEVEDPASAAGRPVPELILLPSPYRFVVQPVIDHILAMEREYAGRGIAVVIPELVKRRWYHHFLHNRRGRLLEALLLARGLRRIAIVNVPWYLDA